MDSNPRSPAYDEFGASGRAHATHAAIMKPRKPIVRVASDFAARLAFHIDKVGRGKIGFGDLSTMRDTQLATEITPVRRHVVSECRSAIVDARAEFGVEHIELPTTPERIWRAIQASRHQQ